MKMIKEVGEKHFVTSSAHMAISLFAPAALVHCAPVSAHCSQSGWYNPCTLGSGTPPGSQTWARHLPIVHKVVGLILGQPYM